ncbi:mitochondrial carnitine/acylcarnitine carrier protein-like [Palaemon carinicauda]|uniref:mitochondrial carnitine/acylcarnitine carrier protein-like n=1 Tax=Palaemon carinicauda TaxID=392227 RepID=UPI0035B5A888
MAEKNTSLVKNFLAGGFSGITAISTGQPFDTIKVRLQTQPLPELGQKPLYQGALDCTIKTIKNDGFLGLYKGMAVPLMAATPIFAVSFFGFNFGKRLQQKTPGETLKEGQIFAAGMLSGVFTSTIVTPGDRIKCILQVQTASAGPKLYNGPLDVAKALFKQGGVSSFYKGMCATLLRDVPGGGTFYLTYYLARKSLSPEGQESEPSPLRILVAGGLAGVVSWSVALGPDVLKSRIQTAPEGKYPHGIRSVFVDILRNEGPRAFFKGAVPLLLRAFPANSACLLGYEGAMNFLNWIAPSF